MDGGWPRGRRCIAVLGAVLIAVPAVVIPSPRPTDAQPTFPAVVNVVFDGSGTAVYDHVGDGNGHHYHQVVEAEWHLVWRLPLPNPEGTSYPTTGTVTGT